MKQKSFIAIAILILLVSSCARPYRKINMTAVPFNEYRSDQNISYSIRQGVLYNMRDFFFARRGSFDLGALQKRVRFPRRHVELHEGAQLGKDDDAFALLGMEDADHVVQAQRFHLWERIGLFGIPHPRHVHLHANLVPQQRERHRGAAALFVVFAQHLHLGLRREGVVGAEQANERRTDAGGTRPFHLRQCGPGQPDQQCDQQTEPRHFIAAHTRWTSSCSSSSWRNSPASAFCASVSSGICLGT